MTNLADGGCGYVGKRSEETRAKMRKPKSEAHRQKIREHVLSPAMAEKRLAALDKRNPGNTYGRGERNAQAVLTENDVIQIRKKLQDGISLTVLRKAYGVSKAAMSKIRTGRTWKHLGILPLPT